MDELTVPQPLATLAVEGVVKVLVVPEPPKCPECDGLGVVGWRVNVGTALAPVASHPMCLRCIGDGLARWPAEVTIRSSRVEPEYRHGPLLNAGWQLTGDRESLAHWHHGQWLPSHGIPRGEVLGSVTVEAAVPVTTYSAANLHPYPYIGIAEHKDYDALVLWPPEGEQVDLADQLAFQDFPVGHTALILGGETDA